jgi:hypothetical protein
LREGPHPAQLTAAAGGVRAPAHVRQRLAGGQGDRPTANPYFGVPDEENSQFAAEIYHARVTPAVQTAQVPSSGPAEQGDSQTATPTTSRPSWSNSRQRASGGVSAPSDVTDGPGPGPPRRADWSSSGWSADRASRYPRSPPPGTHRERTRLPWPPIFRRTSQSRWAWPPPAAAA